MCKTNRKFTSYAGLGLQVKYVPHREGVMDCYGVVLYTSTLHLHSWVKWQKTRQKLIEKFAKLTDLTYACNSLTNFVHIWSACNHRKRKMQSAKICLQKKANLFLAGFRRLKPQYAAVLFSSPCVHFSCGRQNSCRTWNVDVLPDNKVMPVVKFSASLMKNTQVFETIYYQL